MSETNKPYTIVVGVDFSEAGDLALTRAFEIAAEKASAKVHAVSVITLYRPEGSPRNEVVPTLSEAGARLREHVEQKAAAFRVWHPGKDLAFLQDMVGHIRTDAPADEVAQLAADLEADLVVVGTHGLRGFSRLVLGSVAEAIIRLAPCTVLVARPKAVPAAIPSIEPPCPRCVEARRTSASKELWCEQHRERHGQRHTYHQADRVGQATNMPLVFRS